MEFLLLLCFLFASVSPSIQQCSSFPSALDGTWTSTNLETITIDATSMSLSTTKTFQSSHSASYFECVFNSGTQYVFKMNQTVQILSGTLDVIAYGCFDFQQTSAYSYYYYLNSAEEITLSNLRFRAVLASAVDTITSVTDICDSSTVDIAEFYTMVKTGHETAAISAVKCPDPILGCFQYTYTDQTGTYCENVNTSIIFAGSDQKYAEALIDNTGCTAKEPFFSVLTEVVRQTDKDMIKAIKEISIGIVSDETVQLIKDLQRPLQEESIKLFSTNDLVDDYNRDRILDFPGQLHENISTDTGDKKYLKEMIAPRNLWLKIGIPVILIKNLSDQLVNGLRGTVYDIQEDGKVLVEFPNMKEATYIETVKFEVFDPRKNAVVAVREQYPLKPAYALTIHKSQGMTLERVQVDCRDIFKPGQLGVAIGRARTLEGLRVINFTSQAYIKQPEKILRFVNTTDSLDTEQDRSCCNCHVRLLPSTSGFFDTSQLTDIDRLQNAEVNVEATIDELDDDFNQVIANLEDDETENITLPENINLKAIIEKIRSEIVVTPMQYENNEILSRMEFSKLEHFAKVEYKKLSSLLDECPSHETGQISSKDLGDFYTKVHQHALSLDFKMNCLKLFENESTYDVAHQHICFNISMELRKYILTEKAKQIEATARTVSQRTITHASRARVRYVGGYCIAKVRHKYVTKKSSCRYSNNKNDKEIYENAKCALKILNSLKQEEQNILACTVEPDSLLDVSRRQNLNRGLTNISDNLFKFFIKLTDECLTLFTGKNLNKMGKELFTKCQNEIASSLPLYEEFVKICCTEKEQDDQLSDSEADVAEVVSYMTLQVIQIEDIYRHIIKYFLLVMLNQFRKDVLDSYKVEKKMAHRKQIRVASNGKRDTLEKHSSPTKAVKNKRKITAKRTPQASPAEQDTSPIESSNMPSTSASAPESSLSLLALEPGPSACESEHEQSVVSEQHSESDSEVNCKVCDTHDKGTEWIQCDSCNAWLHRNCAGLRHHMKWKKYQKKGSKFLCKECE